MPILPKFGQRRFGQTLQNIILQYDPAASTIAYTGASGIQSQRSWVFQPAQLNGMSSITLTFTGSNAVGAGYWYIVYGPNGGPWKYSPAPGMSGDSTARTYAYVCPVKNRSAGMTVWIGYNSSSSGNVVTSACQVTGVGRL